MATVVTMNSERKKKRIQLIPGFHGFFVAVSASWPEAAANLGWFFVDARFWCPGFSPP